MGISIVQSFNLKEIIEELELKRDEVKIASVDAIKMYPSTKLSTTKKVAKLFTRKTTAGNQGNHQYLPGDHPFWE